jgi:hypothetical protein
MSMVRRSCMLLLIVFFTFIAAGAVFSMENMFLAGVITKIDYKTRQVQIHVLNKGCNGDRTFIIGDISKFKKTVGKKIGFYIDSEDCPGPFEMRIITAVQGVE